MNNFFLKALGIVSGMMMVGGGVIIAVSGYEFTRDMLEALDDEVE